MSKEFTIGGNGEFFVGEDKRLRLRLRDRAGLRVDLTGWAGAFVARAKDGTVLVDEPFTVEGTYNSADDLNTQWLVVTLTDEDTSVPAGTHRHSWKRTDEGFEVIVGHGPLVLEEATQT